MTTTVQHPVDLLDLAGQTLGTTDWYPITQDRVNMFADATGDHQWIHTDPERAAAGPFGGTIAHGYLTLSLAARAIGDGTDHREPRHRSQLRVNKVRFPAPVAVGSKIRAAARIASARPRDHGIEAVIGLTFEAAGSDRPACVAECVVIYR
ncbi:MaoC family dehydratase [Rhodococcus sp. NPDC003348]